MLSVTAHGAAALLLSLLFSLMIMPRMIEWLRRLKAGQSISEDAPTAHQAKTGTPTMGGLGILAALTLSVLFLSRGDVFTNAALLLTLAFGAVGFLDDFLIVRRGKNLGLRAREKMALQVLFALVFIVIVRRNALVLPIGSELLGLEPLARLLSAPLGLFSPAAAAAAMPTLLIVLDLLFVVGLANAVNFSDGLDGLASGLTVIAALSAALLLPAGVQGSLEVFVMALAGGCLGFLWFNGNPARVFMGDTGSLALGGALGAFAVLTRTEMLFFILGAVYWAELFSVMIQVTYFKRTGRRVFRMSPIHHHFELCGWKEPQIVTRFWIVGAAAGMLAILLAH